jgi:hypothetical protein
MSIVSFWHCKSCLNKRPAKSSPREWARFEFGATIQGFQLRCVRCDKNIIHLDLMGRKVRCIDGP